MFQKVPLSRICYLNMPLEQCLSLIMNSLLSLKIRGCATGGHGVIRAHFAKMTPNFGFLAAFGGHS